MSNNNINSITGKLENQKNVNKQKKRQYDTYIEDQKNNNDQQNKKQCLTNIEENHMLNTIANTENNGDENIHTPCNQEVMFEKECLICFGEIFDEKKTKSPKEYLEKLFFRACKFNKIKFVEKIFSIEESSKKCKLLNSIYNAKTALHYSIKNNNIALINLFLKQSLFDIFNTPKNGKSAFLYAASNIIEDTKLSSETLAKYIDSEDGKFDLEKCNYLELISELIEKEKEKILPFKMFLFKLGAILKSITNGKEHLNHENFAFKYLTNLVKIFSKAMTEAINSQNYYVLHMMLTTSICFEKISSFTDFFGPISAAVLKGDVNIIKMLVDHKLNFVITNNFNAVHILCSNGFLSSAKFVINKYYLDDFEYYHKYNIVNSNQTQKPTTNDINDIQDELTENTSIIKQSSLDVSKQNNNDSNIVVENNQNFKHVFRCTTENQMTVLHLAALHNKPNTLRYLLNLNGAEKYINKRNKKGYTPLISCCISGNNACLKVFLELPYINILTCDKYSNSPIVCATYFNRNECAEELLGYISQKITSLRNSPKDINTENLIKKLILEKEKWLLLTIIDKNKKHLIKLRGFKDETNYLENVFNNIQTIKDLILLDRHSGNYEPKKLLPMIEFIIDDDISERNYFLKTWLALCAHILDTSFIFKKLFDFKSNKVDSTYDNQMNLHTLYLPYFDVLDQKTYQQMEDVGRFMALAIAYKPVVYLRLSIVFFKTLFDEIITLEDILPQDQINFLRNMKSLTDEEILGLDLYFKEKSMFKDGTFKNFDLIPGGSNIKVNKENLDLYLKSKLEFYTVKGNRNLLLKAFKDGFNMFIPKEYLKYFDSHTLITLTMKKK